MSQNQPPTPPGAPPSGGPPAAPPAPPPATPPPAGGEPPAPPTPPTEVDYTKLKLGENSRLKASAIEKVTAIAKAQNLSFDQAQALLTHDEETATEAITQYEETIEGNRQRWLDEAKADPVIGGANFETNVRFAQHAMKKFGDEAFTKWIEETGRGNDPTFLRVFAKIGKEMSEGRLPEPSGTDKPAHQRTEDIWYPSMHKK